MKCPYCNKEMEIGVLHNQREISWIPGEKRRFFANPEFHEGSVVLSEFSFLRGSALKAWLCRDCKKLIVDLADEGSDLNH